MYYFDYLKSIDMLAPLHRYCDAAERYQLIAPEQSALKSRQALEWMTKEIHKMKGHVPEERESLYDLVTHPIFTGFINDERLMMAVHYIRKKGNKAAHPSEGEVTKREAFFTLLNLYNFVGAVLIKLRVVDSLPEFDGNLVPKTLTPITPDIINTPVVEEAETFADTVEPSTVEAAPEIAANMLWDEISEAETRRLYIDTMLEEAGWEVVATEGAKVDGKACIEVEVHGMPNNAGVGYADYVLFGRDLTPLAVIEAKRTSVDPNVGKQQAILYADCLESEYGVRPAVYYTNGFETFFIDGIGYPARKVFAYHSIDDLERNMKRRNREVITDMSVNDNISGRYYQKQAVKRLCEWLNSMHRRGLLVMATGTGKTRTAISLVDVLERADWVKNTLFLADRTSLVKQAQRAFKKHMPDTSTTILNEDGEDADLNARIIFSTYQTMIKKIDTENKLFSVGRFDIIIIDEAHRSVFGKFGAIFNYFDSFLVGLTATPRDQVDKSTYDLLGLEGGEPNFAYELDQAVEDKYLVPYEGYKLGSSVVNEGIKYDDLTPEERDQLEKVWEYEQANADPDIPFQPRDIESSEIYKYIFNIDTVDKVLQTLMERGIKVDDGEKIGKTIIFAFNSPHAQLIVDRFYTLYPQYGDDFCEKIDYTVKYGQKLIDNFCESDKMPQIAVSVDMLDTGIDATSVVNLVFFKRVRSRIKFDQMIGRGTRLHPGLFGDKDKDKFYIFDWCGNFNYFDKPIKEPNKGRVLSLTERLFNVRCEIAAALQSSEYQEDEFAKTLHDGLKDTLLQQVNKLNDRYISVREHLAAVHKFRKPETWQYISAVDVLDLQNEVSPLLESSQEDVNALRFDLLSLYVQLGLVDEEFNSLKYEGQIQIIANLLQKRASIPEVAQKMETINLMLTQEFWDNKSLETIEKMRIEIRDLLKYIKGDAGKRFTVNIQDNITDEGVTTGNLTSTQTYKQKVIDFLNQNRNLPVLQKIANLEQLTTEDITELERILWEELGTKEDYERYLNRENLTVGDSVGAFIRHLNGVDRERALQMFTEYISQNDLTADQEEYLKSILDYVCQNGDMTKREIVNNHIFAERLQEIFPDKAMQVLQFVGHIHQSITAA